VHELLSGDHNADRASRMVNRFLVALIIVTVLGLCVVVLGGALAGTRGGLMELVDPSLAQGSTGMTAILVVLMLCLWAHAQGDKLAAATPRRSMFGQLTASRVSENLASLVDVYGQIRIRPAGEPTDLEGYPPFPEDLREELAAGSWRFPAKLSADELEARLEERLERDQELAEVEIDEEGRAVIAAAPPVAGLSRRIPSGKRGVSIQTLLPTGMAWGGQATLRLPSGEVTGTVVSARATSAAEEARTTPAPTPEPVPDPTAPAVEKLDEPTPSAPTTPGARARSRWPSRSMTPSA